MCCYGGVRMRKNRNNLSFTNLLGFFIVSILGCINHFICELSGKNTLAASITPINESTWEHLKLLFFPFIAYIIFEFFIYGKHISGFLFSCVIGVLSGMIFIPAAFYTINAVFGQSGFIVNILLFFAAVYISFKVRSIRIQNGIDQNKMRTVPALILIICITVLFVGFTFFPPDSSLFKSPV